ATQTKEEINNQEAKVNDTIEKQSTQYTTNTSKHNRTCVSKQQSTRKKTHESENNVNKEVHINHITDTHLDNHANQSNDRQDEMDKSLPGSAFQYIKAIVHKLDPPNLEFSPDNSYTKETLDTIEVDTPPQKQVATTNSESDRTNIALQNAEANSLAKESDISMPDF
ncbi:13560_t:CDS:2, partial [Dentiscutata heterogama]